MNLGLKHQVVLVTGGSKGIGRAIALQYAEEGATVAITYHKDKEAAAQTAEQIQAAGSRCIAVQMSLSDESSIRQAVQSIKEQSGAPISVLINNALDWSHRSHSMQPPLFEDVPSEHWTGMIDTNLKGTYYVTKEVMPSLRQNGWGRLVHISSDLAQDGLPGASSYTSLKAALHGLSRTLSKELASLNIYSNVVLPGFTLTENAKKSFPSTFIEEYSATKPTKRLGTPEDVAKPVVFLGSPANSYITGEMIRITGGA